MAGYEVNSGEMGSVASKIDSIRDTVSDNAKQVGKTDIEAKDFGRAHTQAGAPFTALLTALSKLVSSEATAMGDYSSRLRDSSSEYDSNEWKISSVFGNLTGGA